MTTTSPDPGGGTGPTGTGGVVISKRVLLINSASAMVQRVLSLTVLIWLQQYLLKRISEEEYEIYRVVTPLMAFLPIVSLVVGGALGRYITESYARSDLKRVTQIVSTLFPYCFAGAGFILLIGAVLTVFIDKIYVISPGMLHDARLMLGVLVAMGAVRVLGLPFNAGLHVRQKFLWMHLIGLGAEIVRLATLFTLLFGVSTRVLWVVLASVPANLLGLAVTIALSRRLIPALRFRPREFRRELVRPLLSFGGWMVIAKIAASTRDFMGPFLLNRFAGSAAVGSFGLGSLVERRLFGSALGPITTTQPILTALHATGQTDRLRRYYFRFSRYLLWAFLVFSVPLIVLRNELFSLYLDEAFDTYREAAVVMALMLARGIFVFPQPVLAQLALAKARQRANTQRAVLVEALNVVLMVVFVWGLHLGAMGAALALFVGGALGMTTFLWSWGIKLTSSSWSVWMRETVWPGLLPTLVATPVALAMHGFAPPTTWIDCGLQATVSCSVYLLVLYRFCMLDVERKDLGRLLGKASRFLPGRKRATAES